MKIMSTFMMIHDDTEGGTSRQLVKYSKENPLNSHHNRS